MVLMKCRRSAVEVGRGRGLGSLAVGALVVGVVTGCTPGPTPLEDTLATLQERPAWDDRPALSHARHPAEKFLKDWTIVLDPGHGGDAHLPNFKRGPTGVREAEINWRVAVLLRELLEGAGAHVVLTRDGDEDVSLAERAEVANTVVRRRDGGVGADLFLSLHHNAASKPTSNYTSVWFHGTPETAEPDLDAARYLAHRIADNLRTDVALTSPLMSDLQMYKGGFGVLRMAAVPAVLTESSFHSNPAEEQRLRDADYNLREAYAMYEALCEYAYGGRPTQATPTVRIEGSDVVVQTTLDDGLPKKWWGADRPRTLPSTIHVTLDGRPLAIDYDPATHALRGQIPRAALPDPDAAARELVIHHANLFKHHNWPQRYAVTLGVEASAGEHARVEPLGHRRADAQP